MKLLFHFAIELVRGGVIGVFLYFWVFPDKGSEVSLGKIGVDILASILMAFVIVYASDWFRKWIDSRFFKRR